MNEIYSLCIYIYTEYDNDTGRRGADHAANIYIYIYIYIFIYIYIYLPGINKEHLLASVTCTKSSMQHQRQEVNVANTQKMFVGRYSLRTPGRDSLRYYTYINIYIYIYIYKNISKRNMNEIYSFMYMYIYKL